MAVSRQHLKGSIENAAQYFESYYAGSYYDLSADPDAAYFYGSGCALAGISREYNPDLARQLLAGGLPDGTDVTARGGVNAANRRMATDVCLSPPKSVSAIALCGGDLSIIADHDAANAEAMAFLEREMVLARFGSGGSEKIKTGVMLAAAFRHEDARPVSPEDISDLDKAAQIQKILDQVGAGQLVGPSVHSHNMILNLTHDGQAWRACELDFGRRGDLLKLVNHIYLSALRRRLEKRGYATYDTADGFEIQGIEREQIESISPRREQVEQYQRKHQGASNDDAAVKSRSGKDVEYNESSLRGHFADVAEAVGIDIQGIAEQARQRQQIEIPNQVDPAVLADQALRSAIAEVSEKDTVFTLRNLRTTAMSYGWRDKLELVHIDEAIARAAQSQQIYVRENLVTTREALAREVGYLAAVDRGRGSVRSLMSLDQANTLIDTRDCEAVAEGKYQYTAGQADAIRLALSTRDRIIAIRGAAGSGKTTSAISTLTEIGSSQGYEVVGLAPTNKAASGLAEAGITDQPTMTGYLLQTPSAQGSGNQKIYVLDEAGMVSDEDVAALIERVENEGARLVMVGDQRQLQPVGAGTPFENVLRDSEIQVADMSQIIRQSEAEDRAMVEAFATGDAERGAAILANRYAREIEFEPEEGMTRHEEKQAREVQLIEEAASAFLQIDRETREKSMVLSASNRVRQAVNGIVRSQMIEQGEIDTTYGIEITALEKAKIGGEARHHALNYRPGWRITGKTGRKTVFKYKVIEPKGRYKLIVEDIKTGKRKTVDVRKINIGQARIMTERRMELAPGDTVLFRDTLNLSKELRIANSASGIVRQTKDGKVTLELDDDRIITIPANKPLPIDYGWARTVHASQGATVKQIIFASTGTQAENANLSYVAASRHKAKLRIISADLEKSMQSWTRWAASLNSRHVKRGVFDREKEQIKQEMLAEVQPDIDLEMPDLPAQQQQIRQRGSRYGIQR